MIFFKSGQIFSKKERQRRKTKFAFAHKQLFFYISNDQEKIRFIAISVDNIIFFFVEIKLIHFRGNLILNNVLLLQRNSRNNSTLSHSTTTSYLIPKLVCPLTFYQALIHLHCFRSLYSLFRNRWQTFYAPTDYAITLKFITKMELKLEHTILTSITVIIFIQLLSCTFATFLL